MDERFGDATWRTRMSAWLLGAFRGAGAAARGARHLQRDVAERRAAHARDRRAPGARRGARRHPAPDHRPGRGRRSRRRRARRRSLAIPAMRLLSTLLYQVKPGDPSCSARLRRVLLAVAMLAGYMPARRATRVDPLKTLRAE